MYNSVPQEAQSTFKPSLPLPKEPTHLRISLLDQYVGLLTLQQGHREVAVEKKEVRAICVWESFGEATMAQ